MIEGIERAFLTVKEAGLTISSTCRSKHGKFTCRAYKVLETVSIQTLKTSLEGGKNPGSVACRELGGVVVFGEDPGGNENTFCRFKDGSMVSNGTIHHYGIKNDLAAQKTAPAKPVPAR